MHELVNHVVLLADLRPQLIYETPGARDDPLEPPREITSSHEPVRGHDEPGVGVTVHRPAPWRCGCDIALALDYREVPSAWAAHVARFAKASPDRLEAHMLVAIRGHKPTAICRCGLTFVAPEDDPLNSDAAADLWAAHVMEDGD